VPVRDQLIPVLLVGRKVFDVARQLLLALPLLNQAWWLGMRNPQDNCQQARNQRGAIGQLLLPKFSQTYAFVWCSNKLHYFSPPENVS